MSNRQECFTPHNQEKFSELLGEIQNEVSLMNEVRNENPILTEGADEMIYKYLVERGINLEVRPKKIGKNVCSKLIAA